LEGKTNLKKQKEEKGGAGARRTRSSKLKMPVVVLWSKNKFVLDLKNILKDGAAQP
jgi:hypothetical protein